MKPKEIREMNKANRENKMKELKLELIKAKANASKVGSAKIKGIKRIIARIITINKSEENKKSKEKLNKK